MSNHQPKHLEYSFCFQFLAYGTEENRGAVANFQKAMLTQIKKAKSEPIH